VHFCKPGLLLLFACEQESLHPVRQQTVLDCKRSPNLFTQQNRENLSQLDIQRLLGIVFGSSTGEIQITADASIVSRGLIRFAPKDIRKDSHFPPQHIFIFLLKVAQHKLLPDLRVDHCQKVRTCADLLAQLRQWCPQQLASQAAGVRVFQPPLSHGHSKHGMQSACAVSVCVHLMAHHVLVIQFPNACWGVVACVTHEWPTFW